MIFWPIVHSAFSLAMTAVAVVMLVRWKQRYNLAERFGLGLTGGAGLLRVNVIWEMRDSPYFDWAPTIFIIGMFFFLAGRAYRDRRHERANQEQIERSRAYLKSRGVNV